MQDLLCYPLQHPLVVVQPLEGNGTQSGTGSDQVAAVQHDHQVTKGRKARLMETGLQLGHHNPMFAYLTWQVFK